MARAFASTKYSYLSLFYCSLCGKKLKPQKINEWCKTNFYTVSQARTMLKQGKLLGFKHKNRMYVAENPDYEET